jgi:hypothetical protein
MPVYVGIDVHRKRSQVAVIDEGGEVLANRNVPNGVQPVLGVIGGLPPGTPAAFEAAFGWGWLVELLEDYGFDPHLVHPLQCKAIARNSLPECWDVRGQARRAGVPGRAGGRSGSHTHPFGRLHRERPPMTMASGDRAAQSGSRARQGRLMRKRELARGLATLLG